MRRMSLIVAVCVVAVLSSVLYAQEAQRPGLAAQTDLAGRKKIVFLSGQPSHGYAQHEQYAGVMLLAKALNENVPAVYCEVYKHVWPTDAKAFDNTAAVIFFCDGGEGHLALKHLPEMNALADTGVGIGMIHYAVEVPKGPSGDTFVRWIGGYFETDWSINPVWTGVFIQLPDHDVTRGVHPFSTRDEWYYHMRFRPEMLGVTSVLATVPPDATREHTDDPHNGNPIVRAGIGKHISETTIWVATRDNGGRGFGCTGAHYHFNWAQDDFRKLMLNACLWTAHVPVPEKGVPSKRPTVDDLLANLDEKPVPADFSKEKLAAQIENMNQPINVENRADVAK